MIAGLDTEFTPMLQHQKVTSSEEGIEGNAPLELFSPPFDSNLRKSSLLTATFNLVATIIGGSFPRLFSLAILLWNNLS